MSDPKFAAKREAYLAAIREGRALQARTMTWAELIEAYSKAIDEESLEGTPEWLLKAMKEDNGT